MTRATVSAWHVAYIVNATHMATYAWELSLMRYRPSNRAEDFVEFAVSCRIKTGKLRVLAISFSAPALHMLTRDVRPVCLRLNRWVRVDMVLGSDVFRASLLAPTCELSCTDCDVPNVIPTASSIMILTASEYDVHRALIYNEYSIGYK